MLPMDSPLRNLMILFALLGTLGIIYAARHEIFGRRARGIVLMMLPGFMVALLIGAPCALLDLVLGLAGISVHTWLFGTCVGFTIGMAYAFIVFVNSRGK
jgi:hypothetical protein